MKVVVLCGGKGTRSFPFTHFIPKPMMPLGGTPVIVHLIKNCIRQGFDDFILAAGYRKAVLDDYFDGKNFGARISIIDTGDEASTGARVLACRDQLGDGPFIVTYGDGLCDVPMTALVDFHRSHSGLVTVTSVPMASQYGVLWTDAGGQVDRFAEKPLIRDHWINVGFMVFDNEAFEYFNGDSIETGVLPRMIERRLVYSYRHDGFFKSVDSYKDVVEFEEFFNASRLPWINQE